MGGTELILESSAWLIPVCVAAGALYAFLLYFRDRQFTDLPNWLRKLLPVLRFFLAAIVVFLLLEPFLRSVQNTEKKPILVVAQDNSSSLASWSDSAWLRNQYPDLLAQQLELLSEKFEIIPYSFAGETEPGLNYSFTGMETDISGVFSEIRSRLGNLNLGAVVIPTDGSFNKGLNPIYQLEELGVPVYPIALGDTLPGKDLIISAVFNNRIAFLGNTFPVEIVADADLCKGCKSSLQVLHKGRVIHEESYNPDSDRFRKTIKLQLKASEGGHQKYTVRLNTVDGEASQVNNVRNIFVEVLDNRQKILIVAKAPHPDVNALRSAIETQESYESELVFLDDFQSLPNNTSLVIALHLTGYNQTESKILADLSESGIPLWFVAGTSTRITSLPGWVTGLSAENVAGRFNDVFPVLNTSFTLFTIDEALSDAIRAFPPLSVPFGKLESGTGATVLFRQKIGSVATTYPLWTFTETNNRKASFIAGEGLWRWRLANYQSRGNSDAFNQLVQKTVQYLSLKTDRRQFRVVHKEAFDETEKVILEAELYNQAFELVNEPDVEIAITNEEDEDFSYQLGRTGNAYRLDAGNFPAGIYRYTARVNFNGKLLSDNGEFLVRPVSTEMQDISADHALLHEMAERSGGQFIRPASLNQLSELLNAREELKPVISSEIKLRPFVDLWWVLLLVLMLVSGEWFIRRRYGAY